MKLMSPEGRAAFQGYIPSIVRRHKVAAVMGTPVNHLNLSYPWAGTIVADTFYGRTERASRPALHDNWNGGFDNVIATMERG